MNVLNEQMIADAHHEMWIAGQEDHVRADMLRRHQERMAWRLVALWKSIPKEIRDGASDPDSMLDLLSERFRAAESMREKTP